MKKLVMLCMAASMSSLTFAQSKVTGVVKDATGEPIIGASVTVKGLRVWEPLPTSTVISRSQCLQGKNNFW